MTPEILIAVGVTLALALLVQAALSQRSGSRLKLRLASIADPGDAVQIEDGGSRRAERFFLCVGKDREEVVIALRGAGYRDPRSVLIFAALRFFASLLAAAVVLFATMGGAHSGRAKFYAIGAGFAAFLLSKMVLRSRVNAQMRQIGKELPFLLDTLLLLLESGVSLDQALRYFAQSEMGGMDISRRAVAAMVDDLQRGVPYATALDRWADRLPVPGVRELAALFKQALLHGTELGPALRAFTQEFADKRLSASRASIGKKTTQMTMVMIMFMMPALFIVLGGPAVSTVQDTMATMGSKK